MPGTIFCDFFFFDVELILSVKKCKKVIFEEKRLKKFARNPDYPLKVIFIFITRYIAVAFLIFFLRK